MNILAWSSAHSSLTIAVGLATVCFLSYWFLAHSLLLNTLLSKKFGAHTAHDFGAFFQKAVGIVLIGFVPGLAAMVFLPESLTFYGLGAPDWKATAWWVISMGWVLVLVPYISVRKPEMLAFYPQVRARIWGPGLVMANAVMWGVYLLSYEFLFRGFLLNSCLDSIGAWPAIAVTTSISAATHMPKGATESFGTIPLSILLCMAAIHTGAIWAGVFLHVLLALANDFWALYFQPDMKIQRWQPA